MGGAGDAAGRGSTAPARATGRGRGQAPGRPAEGWGAAQHDAAVGEVGVEARQAAVLLPGEGGAWTADGGGDGQFGGADPGRALRARA